MIAGNRRFQMTEEESIRTDNERVWIIDRVMDSLGFNQQKVHRSSMVPGQFTDLIIYLDEESGDSVAIYFPNEDQYDRGLEITTEAKFNNKINSPEWQSLHELQNQIVPWIEECRRKEGPNG
jgi:hypothetical protein